jgi:hypothetical protein
LDFWRRFLRRREGVLGIAIIGFFAGLAIAPELFVGPLQTVTTATGGRLQPPVPNTCWARTSLAARCST